MPCAGSWPRCFFARSLFAFLVTANVLVVASNTPVTDVPPLVLIPRVNRPPKLEDFLQMKSGPGAPAMARVDSFLQYLPKDGAPSQEKTEAYLGYDSKNLYVVFICFDKVPGRIRARMAHREDIGDSDDTVAIYLDTFNDKRRAYTFLINPLGVQLDGIYTDGNGNDTTFDTVWDSKGKLTEEGYVGLMSIPFKSLRFSSAPQQVWGILLYRGTPHDNEFSYLPHVSTAVQSRLSQLGTMEGLEHISPGRNIQLAPYVIADAFRNLDQRDPNHPFFTGNHLGGDTGLDGKMIVKDSLVLDFTVNPDFRQLESDEPQNTLNQQFQVFFPERRPFFQEGTNFFQTPTNLYFTRNIADPQYGVRLTGKLGPYGIGLLASDDQSPGRVVPDGDPLRRKRAYFTVGRLTRELWKQSQVGVFYSDREMAAPASTLCSSTALSTDASIGCTTLSNRVGAADFHFQLTPHFVTEGQAGYSVNDQADGTHAAGNFAVWTARYTGRHLQYNTQFRSVSSGFVTLTGFFQRPGVRSTFDTISYTFRPEGKIITSWGPQYNHFEQWDYSGTRLLYDTRPTFNINFKANTQLTFQHAFSRERLRPADYSILSKNIDINGDGPWLITLNSSYFKLVTFNAFALQDKNFNFSPAANQAPFQVNETQGNFTATVHPWNPLTVDNTYILERLVTRNAPIGILNSHIIRSRWTYQYNKELSFRTIFQYNGVIANPLYTSADRQKNFNTDFLVTYLVHPGTAFYLGYNSNLENLNGLGITGHSGLFRTNRSYINDGKTVFAKISYLFRF